MSTAARPGPSAPPWPPSAAHLAALCELRWVRIEFVQVTKDELVLPPHSGHLWRSVLLARMMSRTPDVLERLQLRRPKGKLVQLYALQPPAVDGPIPKGASLHGAVVLFGQAMELAGAVTAALRRFGELGTGGHRTQLELDGLASDGTADAPLDGHRLVLAAQQEAEAIGAGGVEMQLLTPTQLTVDSRPLENAPSFAQLLGFGFDRLAQLVPDGLPGGLFVPGELAAAIRWADGVPRVQDITEFRTPVRYSRSQDQEVWLPGLHGRVAWGLPAAQVWPWLRLFEHLQLGKKTTHGQGVVRFVPRRAG